MGTWIRLHPPMTTPSTLLIVGGGLTGLATAALLRARGAETIVFESSPEVGGRFLPFEKDAVALDVPWSVERDASPLSKALAAGILPPLTSVRLRPHCVTSEGAGPLPSGPVAFVVANRVGSLGTRLALRGTLAKTQRKEDRLDQFYVAEQAGGDFAEILDAWAGPAAAEPGSMPKAAFALAREVLLDKRTLLAHAPGLRAWVAHAAGAAGTVRCNAKVERVVVEGGFARGVVLERGEEVRGRGVVLAVHPLTARGLLAPEDWGAVAGDERLLWESSLPRPGLVLGLTLPKPLREPLFAFVSNPPSFAVGVETRIVATIGLPTGELPSPERCGELAEEAVRSIAKVAPSAADAARGFTLRACDEGWAGLAGGRHRPPMAVGGIEGLFLAGDATSAPHYGIERMLASALQVARLASA